MTCDICGKKNSKPKEHNNYECPELPELLLGIEIARQWPKGTMLLQAAAEEIKRLREIVDKLPPLGLTAKYLKLYAKRLSDDDCNDDSFPDTPELRRFWLKVCEAEDMEKTDWMPDVEGESILAVNYLVATYLGIMAQEAAEKEKDNGQDWTVV